MLYPARLGITARGQAHFLNSAKDAADELDINEQSLRTRQHESAETRRYVSARRSNTPLRHLSVEEIYPLNDFPSIPVVGTAQNLGFYLTFGHRGNSQQKGSIPTQKFAVIARPMSCRQEIPSLAAARIQRGYL